MNYGKQRPLKRWKIPAYVKAIREGLIDPDEPIRIAYVKEWRQEKMYDGQHRTKAASDYGLSFEATVIRDVVDNEIDLLRLNRKIDQGIVRTPNDLTRYWIEEKILSGEFNGQDYSRRVISCIRSALAWRTFQKPLAHSKNEAVDLLDQFADLRNATLDIMQGMNNPSHLIRVAVLAAMMDTIETNEKAAKDFWYRVGTQENVLANAPENKLAKFLLANHVHSGINQTPAFYQKCVSMWNKRHPKSTIDIRAASKSRRGAEAVNV